MKIEPKAFLALEQSMAAALHGEWTRLAAPLIADLHDALSRRDWPGAQSIANGMDFRGVVAKTRAKLEELATSAIIFGAHRASGSIKDTIYANGQLPAEMGTAIDQLEHALEHDAVEFIRLAVHETIDDLRRADATAHMQKNAAYDAALTERTRRYNEVDNYDDNEPDMSNRQVDQQDRFYGRDLARKGFDPDEPREADGKWTTGGSNAGPVSGAPAGTAAQGLQDQGGVSGGALGLAAPSHADLATPLQHLPTKVKVDGVALKIGPYPAARQAAFDYAKEAGLDYHPPTEYAKVDPLRAARIASAYDEMKNDPQDPQVKAAYGAMISECMGQWKAAMASGLKVDFIAEGAPDPYAKSPRLMTEDVVKNNHMWVFPSVSGFGTDTHFDASKNPLLGDAGITVNGHKLVYNDVFRIVHDFFGHVKEGNGFRADGEENAWRSHMAMFTPLARRALTSETRGQNSWVNYGPFGEANRSADAAHTHFADQKVGIMPEWTSTEGSGLPDDPTLKKWDPDEARAPDGKWSSGSVMYHATSVVQGPKDSLSPNIFLSPSKRYASGYGKNVNAFHVRMDKPFDTGKQHAEYMAGRKPAEADHNAEDVYSYARRTGYDSVVNRAMNEVVVFSPDQLTTQAKKFDPDEARDDHGMWTASATHPKPNDHGEPVTIHDPHVASDYSTISDLSWPIIFTPGRAAPPALNGVAFKPWLDHPERAEDWIHVEGQDKKLSMPFEPMFGKSVGSGVIVEEPDGRIWLTAPTNAYGGYRATFPKGTVEHGLNLQGSAIKEAFEETGLKVKITGVLGDFARDTSKARFFTAKRTGGSPADMGWESQAVHLVTPAQAAKLIHRSVDKKILAAYLAMRHPHQDQLFKDDLAIDDLAEDGGLLQPEQGGRRKKKLQRITRTEGAKTLYVNRPLLNSAALITWAQERGFKWSQKPADMHVTICYSKKPFDWDGLTPENDTVVVVGGKRGVQQFGDAIVLTMESEALQQEHKAFRDAGASYDFPEYHPHVTITWDPPPEKLLAELLVYEGDLVFGPQEFQPISDDWKADHEEIRLNKADWDIVGKLNKAVLEGGKVAADLGAQLTTSRLITLGFLAQSQKLGHDRYQVDEVLDEKTCPVCLYMNGKTFRVANQMSRVFQALNAGDPLDVKTLAPWPGQSKEAMSDLYAMDPDEMQGMGFGAPPYHPNCRGMLALAGTVEEGIALGGPPDFEDDLGEAAAVAETAATTEAGEAAETEVAAKVLPELFADAEAAEAADEDFDEEEAAAQLPASGKWDADAIRELGWKRFEVTDPDVFNRIDDYFSAGKYDTAEALIEGWLDAQSVQKEDQFEGPNAPKKKRVNQTPAGAPQDYSDIATDSSSIAFDNSGVQNFNLAPLDRA